MLRGHASSSCDPWLVLGDFNEICSVEEKKGGASVDTSVCLRFKGVIDSCKLIDLGSTGPRFTWRGSQVGSYSRVFKRLDRALCN